LIIKEVPSTIGLTLTLATCVLPLLELEDTRKINSEMQNQSLQKVG
jgi:thiol:disulfide interchange protein